jgi:hypothetical protein
LRSIAVIGRRSSATSDQSKLGLGAEGGLVLGNEQMQRHLVSMIQSGKSFEAVSLARSTVDVVGDLSAAALPAVTVASTSASAGFNDRIRPYAMSETGRTEVTHV